jgi:hypothetical protein
VFSTSITSQQTLLAVAFAVPGGALVIATAVMLMGLPLGADPLWRVEPITLAEASALRDNGEVVRQIEAGADPNAPSRVRADVLRADAVVVTPLEAAVASDRGDMVQVLVEQGATLDAATWNRLACFASRLEADDALAALEARRPSGAPADCEHVQTPW